MFTWLADPIRRLRHGRVAFAGVALLVGITTFLAVAGPRQFEVVSQSGVQQALAAIPITDRVVELSRVDRNDESQPGAPEAADLATIDDQGATFKAGFPASLGAVLGPATAVVETPSYSVFQGASFATEMRLRIMEGAADHVHLIAGKPPTTKVGSTPDPLHTSGGIDNAQPTVLQFEAEISKAAADKLGLAVGAKLVLVPQTVLDPLAGGGGIGVKIVGIYAPNDPADPYWVDDARVTGFTLRELSSNTTLVQSTVLLAPGLYPTLLTGIALQGGTSGGITIPPPSRRVTWRYAPTTDQIHPADIGPVVDGLRRLQGIYPANAFNPDAVSLQTGLLRRLVALEGPWNAAGAVLLLAAAGAAMVALVCLALVIAMTGEERRRVFLLQRERGASLFQSLRAILVEGVLVAVPTALLGAYLAVGLVPEGSDRWVIGGVTAVIGATVLLELLGVLRAVVGPPRLSARPAAVRPGVRARRLILEGVVVVLAIAGAETLRRRGLQGGALNAPTVGASGVIDPTAIAGSGAPDPILAVVPVLVGLAAGIVAIRLAQFPLAFVAWLGGRWRGLGWVLASRRAARAAWASRVLLIILPIATLGAFASATLAHVTRSADLQSWQDVGAPYRVDAGADYLSGGFLLPKALDPAVTPAALPGVTSTVRAYLGPASITGGAQRELVALDVAAYARMLSDSPVPLSLPPDMLAPPAAPGGASTLGGADSPLPAVVSAGDIGPYRAFAVGDIFQMTINTKQLSFHTVAVVDGFPGLPPNRPFVVISWPQLDAAAPGRLVEATSVFAAADPDAGAAIDAAVRQAAPDAVVSSESSQAESLVGQSVVGVLSAGILALATIALGYAALAVVAAFILTAAARADETAQLTTLGLSDWQSRLMLVVEFGPPVLIGVLAGTALGLGLFAYLAPGLGFETILGVLQTAPPGIDVQQIGLLVAAIGAILLLGVALGAPAQRRAAWSSVRRGLR